MDTIPSNTPQDNPGKPTFDEMYLAAEIRAEVTNRTIFIDRNGIPRLRKQPVRKPAPKGKKYCPDCEENREIKLFTSKSNKLYPYCQECRNRQARESHTLEKGRARFLLKNYGITQEEYDLMLFQQCGVCAICGKPETMVHRTGQVQSLSVDHNHRTGDVRELLCNSCNQVVRIVEQDRERIKRVMKYLKKHDR